MSDTPQQPPREPQRPLNEIGHLFLSSIRDRQTNGAARPIRKGPGQSNGQSNGQTAPPNLDPKISIDLTPEEFAEAYGGAAPTPIDPRPQVTAVIATHLNGRQVDRTREYASHLAATHGRVGLIEVDAAEFRLTLFERHAEGSESSSETDNIPRSEPFDVRRMTEALEELSWDVDRWLLLLPNPRIAECRELLRQVQQWTLLATCDHDGVVSCYRTLKGLVSDNAKQPHPQMSLALLDVRSLDEADRVTLKLTGVCEQFLHSKLESEAVIKAASNVSAHAVLCCHANRETAGTPQFDAVRDFLKRTTPTLSNEPATSEPAEKPVAIETRRSEPMQMKMPEVNTPDSIAPESFSPVSAASTFAAPVALSISNATSDVIDLVGDDATPACVVSAFVKGSNNLIETPIKPPAYPTATLAVSRDRRLVLVAVAREGLSDLNAIGSAFRWLCENRPLVAMALPQFAIEQTHTPRLQLLVDQADLRADILQSLLKSEHVTVQSYRKLRWGGKTGLLLEAA